MANTATAGSKFHRCRVEDMNLSTRLSAVSFPQQYRPAVDKGIQEAMEKGVLAGYPVIDVKIALVDGSFHNVDSSEMAFKIAGSLAFKKGAQEAGLVLLEPYMNMVIKVGKDNVGDVMGDLNSRRGKVMGMDSDAKSRSSMPRCRWRRFSPMPPTSPR